MQDRVFVIGQAMVPAVQHFLEERGVTPQIAPHGHLTRAVTVNASDFRSSRAADELCEVLEKMAALASMKEMDEVIARVSRR